MCLYVRVAAPDDSADSLREVAAAAHPDDIDGFAYEGPGFFRRHPPRVGLHACELLTDDADWNAATWSMTPAGRERLRASLAWLLPQLAGDVLVDALWDGDAPSDERRLSADELLAVIASGQVATRTRYVVVA